MTQQAPDHLPIADTLRDLAATIEQAGLPAPKVSVTWHGCDDDTILAVVAAFPDLTWTARSGGKGGEWVDAQRDRVSYVAFARKPEVVPTTPRLAALLNGDLDMAMARACADEDGAA